MITGLLAILGNRSVRVAERLALPTSDHGVAGSNPAGGEILPEPKRRFIAQSLSCSSFHRLEMTEILLKGRKTLTHPSNSRKQNYVVTDATMTVLAVHQTTSSNDERHHHPKRKYNFDVLKKACGNVKYERGVITCAEQYTKYKPPHDKTNNVAVRPAKTQISLGIRPV